MRPRFRVTAVKGCHDVTLWVGGIPYDMEPARARTLAKRLIAAARKADKEQR